MNTLTTNDLPNIIGEIMTHEGYLADHKLTKDPGFIGQRSLGELGDFGKKAFSLMREYRDKRFKKMSTLIGKAFSELFELSWTEKNLLHQRLAKLLPEEEEELKILFQREQQCLILFQCAAIELAIEKSFFGQLSVEPGWKVIGGMEGKKSSNRTFSRGFFEGSLF